jgi:hypothetical protein
VVPYRTLDELPSLLATLAPELAPMKATIDGPRLRITHPPLGSMELFVVLGAIAAAAAAAIAGLIAWRAGVAIAPVAGGTAVVVYGAVFAYSALSSRGWTVEIDRDAGTVSRIGADAFEDRCGAGDGIVLRRVGIGRYSRAMERYPRLALHVSLEQPDGDRRPLFYLVRDHDRARDARRIAAALAAWLGVGFAEHAAAPPAKTAPVAAPAAGRATAPRGELPGERAIAELQDRLGQPSGRGGDTVHDLAALLDLVT